MSGLPLVSIIMPAYNCAETISESINSVLNQTFRDWELIIVNDASVDNTFDIITDYAKKDKRIECISLVKNSGSAYAKNCAIAHAKGDFIAFLDSDDLWHKTKIEKQLSYMIKNNSVFSFTAYEFFYKITDRKRKYFHVPKRIDYRRYLKNTIIGNSTVMMNQKALGTIEIQEGYLEDSLTWMFYLKKGIVADGIDEVLMSYRLRKQSKTSKKIKNSGRYFRCLRETQHLSLFVSLFFWCCYVFNACKKRLFTKKRLAEDVVSI